MEKTVAVWLLGAQGVYFLVTAIWPLVSMQSFERVTGPKNDHWLVKTVAALIGVIGAVMLLGAVRGAPSVEVVALATGSAAALGLVDVIFVGQRRIRPVYLLDAAAEAVLVLLWLLLVWRGLR